MSGNIRDGLTAGRFFSDETIRFLHCVCLNFAIMCPISAFSLWGQIKRGSFHMPGLIVLYQSAWIGWLILGFMTVSAKQSSTPPGRLVNSVSATRSQVEYAFSDKHVLRLRSAPPVSIFRSPATLKGSHGEFQHCLVGFSWNAVKTR